MILMETKQLASGWPEKTAGYGPMAHRLWDFGGSCGCDFSDSTT